MPYFLVLTLASLISAFGLFFDQQFYRIIVNSKESLLAGLSIEESVIVLYLLYPYDPETSDSPKHDITTRKNFLLFDS